MATRFGAVSPAQTYKTKMLWAVGCLLTIVLILAFVIIMLYQTGENPDAAIAATTNPANALAPTQTVDVLVAATRIEEGTRIEGHMFVNQPMDADKKPMAVVHATDLDSVIGKYTKRVINPNIPLVMDDLTDQRPVNTFRIPPGYRAVTIMVDARSGVEGFAKPNSRVDVLWSYAQDGRSKVATIVRFVKVLSVAGVTQASQQNSAIGAGAPVTLLVTEKDAKKIELARTLGALSLSLVGDQEPGASAGEPDSITINDLIGRPATQEPGEEANDGEMYTVDPRSGRQIRYVLRNGRWVRDAGFDEQ